MIELPTAGIELCKLVDVEVMGVADRPQIGARVNFPHYSTDITQAWAVVERMQALGYWVKITGPWEPTNPPTPIEGPRGDGCHGYSVGFDRHSAVSCGSSWVMAEHAFICVAICHAALRQLELTARFEKPPRTTEDLDKIDKIIAEGEEK